MPTGESVLESTSARAPDGRTIQVPVRVDPTNDPYSALTTPEAIRAYYDTEGYVVIRGLVPPELCEAAHRAFSREVKPDRGYFCRHESGRMERHVFTDHGFMKYPMVNFHDVSSRRFPGFRNLSLQVLTHANVQAIVTDLLAGPGKLVHSFFSEGNQHTWAHRDSYYIDSNVTGSLIGVWIAAEDIDAGAGRLYVYPRSHRLTLPQIDEGASISPNDREFKDLILNGIAASGLECRAPALRRGDALVFSSMTVHGSLETTQPQRSRVAIAGHYIPVAQRFLWLRSTEPRLLVREVNGMAVGFHKDQDLFKNRFTNYFLARFPEQYAFVRRQLMAR